MTRSGGDEEPRPLTDEQCGAMGLCELRKGHEGKHSTSVDRALVGWQVPTPPSPAAGGLREAENEVAEYLHRTGYHPRQWEDTGSDAGRCERAATTIVGLVAKALASGASSGPPLGPRESADGPHMPRPTDICTVCGNGLVHIDSSRDGSGASSEMSSQGAATMTAGLRGSDGLSAESFGVVAAEWQANGGTVSASDEEGADSSGDGDVAYGAGDIQASPSGAASTPSHQDHFTKSTLQSTLQGLRSAELDVARRAQAMERVRTYMSSGGHGRGPREMKRWGVMVSQAPELAAEYARLSEATPTPTPVAGSGQGSAALPRPASEQSCPHCGYVDGAVCGLHGPWEPEGNADSLRTLDRNELAELIMASLDRHGESYRLPKRPADLAWSVADDLLRSQGAAE